MLGPVRTTDLLKRSTRQQCSEPGKLPVWVVHPEFDLSKQ